MSPYFRIICLIDICVAVDDILIFEKKREEKGEAT